MMPTTGTARTRESPLRLLRDAAGSPRDVARKAGALGRALWGLLDGRALGRRLERLHDLGYVEEVPNRVQLMVGSADMLRFWIVPCAADYYAQKGINFTFHQVLRFLDEPASMVDPTGFLTARDTIIGHLMQVVHANPAYDLQLLDSHEDGIDELQRQVEQMIAGTHPRARSIGAIVEDPEYHGRLLEFVRAYKRDRDARAPIRENITAGGPFARIERTFGTLPAAMRYFARLPRSLPAAVLHLATVKVFPDELAEQP